MAIPTQPLATRRADLITRLAEVRQYDIAIVGGGATGLGVALDAAARGFSVVLVESHDFAKGTSSRATKLVHGGVRYLAQGISPSCAKRCMNAPPYSTMRPIWRNRWHTSYPRTNGGRLLFTGWGSRCTTRWRARPAWARPNF